MISREVPDFEHEYRREWRHTARADPNLNLVHAWAPATDPGGAFRLDEVSFPLGVSSLIGLLRR
jgi:hypothetical protein